MVQTRSQLPQSGLILPHPSPPLVKQGGLIVEEENLQP
jgi:hypothetical protein